MKTAKKTPQDDPVAGTRTNPSERLMREAGAKPAVDRKVVRPAAAGKRR